MTASYEASFWDGQGLALKPRVGNIHPKRFQDKGGQGKDSLKTQA